MKKFKTFLGSELKTGRVKCPYCKDIFYSIRDWDCTLKKFTAVDSICSRLAVS